MNKSNSVTNPLMWSTAVLLAAILAGCGGGGGGSPAAAGVAPTLPGAGTGLNGAGKGPTPVALGTAGNYVILSKSGISTIPTSVIIGNLGVSPIAASSITGFGALPLDATKCYSTSSQVTGNIYAADYSTPNGSIFQS